MITLDWEGVRQLLAAARGSRYYHVFHLAVFTGLRRSELLGLHWKDVDTELATLSVSRGFHGRVDKDLEPVYWPPKKQRKAGA